AGLPRAWGTALMAVLVASFAGTTLDTAIRLQRYVVQELLGAVLPGAPSSAWKGLPARSGTFAPDAPRTGGLEALSTQARSALKAGSDTPIQPGRPHALAFLTNAYVATFVAVVTAAFLAAIPASGVWSLETAGTGGLILWPLFGASNQLLAGLAFAVILFYLRRRRIATLFLVPPMLLMLVVSAWAMMEDMHNWSEWGRSHHSALAD